MLLRIGRLERGRIADEEVDLISVILVLSVSEITTPESLCSTSDIETLTGAGRATSRPERRGDVPHEQGRIQNSPRLCFRQDLPTYRGFEDSCHCCDRP